MIKNTAFLAALTVFLLASWLAGELSFLAQYKVALFRYYGMAIAVGALLVFFNLCAAYYGLARWLFLRDTGRKLMHVDRQLIASDGVHQDVPVEEWSPKVTTYVGRTRPSLFRQSGSRQRPPRR